jgi:hypothetical protein
VSYNYDHIFDECVKSRSVAIDPVKGRDGLWGVTITTKDKCYYIPYGDKWVPFRDRLLNTDVSIAVWDLRRVSDWPASTRLIWDVKSMYGGDMNLPALARQINNLFSTQHPKFQKYLDLDQKMIAHSRALKTARIEMATTMAVPGALLVDWIMSRSTIIYELFTRIIDAPNHPLVDDYVRRFPFIWQLRQMERAGIAVNVDYVEEMLNGDTDPASSKALRSLHGLCRDGLVTTLLNPMGAKTGRIRHEGGFNTLGVPHGHARKAIVSRWPGGRIYTFDFNAIDYRCIVRAVGGQIAELYAGAPDFHERTASFIFKTVTPYRRTGIKYLSYVYIYGGSDETIVERTGWTMEQVKAATFLLDKKIGPIKEFREKLWMEGTESGFIKIPGGRDVKIEKDDSPGKVIGLFAQSYSSWVFEQAFVKVMLFLQSHQSKVIFAVHDELVIDVHPDEFELMENVLRAMQTDDNVIKMKKGPSYGEQTD